MAFSETAKCPPEGPSPRCNAATELLCDAGVDKDECKLPSFCLDVRDPDGVKDFDGNVCQRRCPETCDFLYAEGIYDFVICPYPPSKNGCGHLELNTGYCMPLTKDENGCPKTCKVDCGDGSDGTVKCPGGIGWDGCPQSDYCMFSSYNEKTGGICPGVCNVNCDYDAGELWCDAGNDKDGCWLGAYCATECAKDN